MTTNTNAALRASVEMLVRMTASEAPLAGVRVDRRVMN